MSKQAVIIANGELTLSNATLSLIRAADYIICADGGLRHALALHLEPDLVVGDLDSLTAEEVDVLRQIGCQIEQHPEDKDATDLELALIAVQRLGIQDVVLVAALGGRLDQTLGNLLLMANPRYASLRLSLVDGLQTIHVVRDQIHIHGNDGDTVSVLALSPEVRGLQYQGGLRWLLDDFTLPFGSTRGLSNEMTAEQAHISLQSGTILVVHSTQAGTQHRGETATPI